MNKSKTVIIYAFILVAIALLSGCSEYEQVNLESEGNEKQQQSTYEGRIDIGSVFYENGSYDYVYGGIVNDSVVINVYHDKAEVETTLPFYIPISRTESVLLPYDESTTIKLIKADKVQGTVELSLTTIKNTK